VASAAYPALGQVSAEYGLGRGFTEPAKRTNGAEKIVKAIVKRLKKGSKKGLFIYSHMMEPHYPYKAEGRTPKDRYLGEIAAVDAALGDLLDVVLDSELSDRIALIVTADHGEAFGEHDSTQHGTTLYEELMRVPLFIRLPGQPAASSPVAASLVDVGPTIIDLFGAQVPASFMGQSLVPVMTGKGPAPDRPLVMESGRMMRSLVEDDRWKYIQDKRHGTVELYDLSADPDELRNIHDDDPARAQRLGGFLDRFFEVHEYRAPGYQLPYYP
jgi:arylsulfatase A-like enzyme